MFSVENEQKLRFLRSCILSTLRKRVPLKDEMTAEDLRAVLYSMRKSPPGLLEAWTIIEFLTLAIVYISIDDSNRRLIEKELNQVEGCYNKNMNYSDSVKIRTAFSKIRGILVMNSYCGQAYNNNEFDL